MVRKYRKGKGTVESGCVGRRGKPAKDGAGISSTYMQLRSRRVVYVRSENPSSIADENGVSSNFSCCESNEYSERSRNVVFGDEFIDLEECRRDGESETSTYQNVERGSTKRKLFENPRDNKSMENCSPVSGDFESETKAKESSDCCCSGRRSSSETEAKSTTEQPTEAEIEDFFAEAEKHLKEKFKKKYNFDFEKEKPLEGHYEWVKLSE